MDDIATAVIMIIPPIIEFMWGLSPRTRNTQKGLKTGSMTAIRFAEIAEIFFMANAKRVDEIPS
jgi:hypothetical protein